MKCTHHFFPEENEHKTCIFSTERNDTNGVTQHMTALGIDATLGDVAKLWALPRPATIPTRHFDSFVLLICWNLWKHRNDVIFRSLPPPHTSDSGMPAGMRPVSGAGDGEEKIILCVMPGALCFLICKHRTTNILP